MKKIVTVITLTLGMSSFGLLNQTVFAQYCNSNCSNSNCASPIYPVSNWTSTSAQTTVYATPQVLYSQVGQELPGYAGGYATCNSGACYSPAVTTCNTPCASPQFMPNSCSGNYIPSTTVAYIRPASVYQSGAPVVSNSDYSMPTSYQPATPVAYAGSYGAQSYATAYSNSNYSMPTYTQTSYQPSFAGTTYSSGAGAAQMKAQQAANMRLRGHVGGGLGGANYEGVGWSTVSPQHAIAQCCYWGQRTPMQIGVARGADGCWYACVLYR